MCGRTAVRYWQSVCNGSSATAFRTKRPVAQPVVNRNLELPAIAGKTALWTKVSWLTEFLEGPTVAQHRVLEGHRTRIRPSCRMLRKGGRVREERLPAIPSPWGEGQGWGW